MNCIKEQVLKALENDDKTIPQLCEAVNIDDDFKMLSIIAELEIEKKVCLKGWKPFYENDDGELRPGFLSKYGLINATKTDALASIVEQ